MNRRLAGLSAVTVLSLCAGTLCAQPLPALTGALAAAAPAQPKDDAPKTTLGVGDKAPELKVSKFVKGEPVTSFEKGTIYVVEFWATWCPPCRESIPHLTKLQKDYKDKNVRIIGVSVWERDESAVEPFVTNQGDKMDYTIAMDDVPKGGKGSDGAMAKSWMDAAGQDGIPAAFIVKNGLIEWIGSPFSIDQPLHSIVNGTYDAQRELAAQKARAASKTKMRAYVTALREGDMAEAGKVGGELVTLLNDDAQSLNEIAWLMVDPDGDVEKPDTDLAMKAAARAVELTGRKDGAILDTLARVHFVKGDVAKAIEIQKEAVAHAPKQFKQQIEDVLKEYEAARK